MVWGKISRWVGERVVAVPDRCRVWANTASVRRCLLAIPLLVIGFQAVAVVLGTVAVSRAGTQAGSGGPTAAIDGLAWTGVKDSSGIPLSDYVFATDHGSLLHPRNTVLSLGLESEFTGFMVIVISAIWLVGCVVSFRWLDRVAEPLTAVGDSLTRQVAIPIVLVTAATVGAFCVAWFVLRGQHARAAIQVATMLAVAVAGATYLAHPLADVLSSHGLLAHARDVGIAVAAGVNGDDTPQPDAIVSGLTATLADNFARHPVQVWNFGHVVDTAPACRAAWSAGVLDGDSGRITAGLSGCGDRYALNKADNPSMGQAGTGLVLLVFGTILLLFLCYLAIKIFLAALSSVYHGLLAVFGFAAGGFIYGPTQAFLIRNLVDIVADAAAMVAYTVFLGIYTLVLDDVFRAAAGEEMAVVFVGGLLLLTGFALLRRLDLGLVGGQVRIAEQIRGALAGRSADSTGSPSSTDLSAASLRYALSPGQLVGRGTSGLEKLAVIDANPLTSLLFRRPNPLQYWSIRQQHLNDLNYRLLRGEVPAEAVAGWTGGLTLGKNAQDAAAREAVRRFGDYSSRSAAAAAANVFEIGATAADVQGALVAAGYSPAVALDAIRVRNRVHDETPTTSPLARTTTALRLAAGTRDLPAPHRAPYAAQIAESAAAAERDTPRPLRPDLVDTPFTDDVMRLVDRRAAPAEFERVIPADHWHRIGEDTRRHLQLLLAQRLSVAAGIYLRTDTATDLATATSLAATATAVDTLLRPTTSPWTTAAAH
ncbi:hypothetical protein [Nocardia sp. BMG111209]|uniref:hypothetical protein n=1 Tax=Nocardia sp. BMG111209 TaxID=1160137 RepID=UPI000477EB7A|nr:hypothetical protein [Nocardia sp. BMG111209]